MKDDIIMLLTFVCIIGGASIVATLATGAQAERVMKIREKVEECKVNDGYYTNISTKSKVEINDLCWKYISIK